MKLLAVALAVALVATLALSGCSSGPSERTLELTVHHSQFSLGQLRVRPGEIVRFVLRNTDPIPHELIVGDQAVQDVHEAGTESHHGHRPGEVSVAPGETAVTTYRFGREGEVLFCCHLPGHWAYGMKGTILVG